MCSRFTFSAAAARAGKGMVFDDDDEEPGEEIESQPELKVGEEREIRASGIRKKLLKQGQGWLTPVPGDEVIVHYIGSLLDGTMLSSTRERGEPVTLKLGSGEVVSGLDEGILTMKMGEHAVFTMPSSLGYGDVGANSVPSDSDLRFDVELITWISVVDVCMDGEIIKRVLVRGDGGKPSDLDEVTVKYKVMLPDGSTVAQTFETGLEFYISEGHFCPAFPKFIRTMDKGERASVTVQPRYAFGVRGSGATNNFVDIPSNATLSIDLELVSFKHVVDVSGDLRVLKKILHEGESGSKPSDGEPVSVRYTGMLEDGTVFEKLGFDEQYFKFVIGEEHVIEGLEKAATTMAKGEVSVLTVKPEYGYGDIEVKRDLAVVPACSTLILEVEMVDFTKEKEPWELNCQEKLHAAQKMKDYGNDLFKTSKYQQASKKYEKALEYVCFDESFESVEPQQVKSLMVSCWLNSAACGLKLNDFQGVISSCSKVLQFEFSNVKALYRRAQAYVETSDFGLAHLDIKKLLEIDPQNRDVVLMHKKLRGLQAEYDKRDANFYTNMFAKRRKDADTALKVMYGSNLQIEETNNMEGDEQQQSAEEEHPVASPTSSVEAMVVDRSTLRK